MLIKAGITPKDSIAIMLEDCNSKADEEVLRKMYQPLESGNEFHVSLQLSEAFPNYVVNMVLIGEESGNLGFCTLLFREIVACVRLGEHPNLSCSDMLSAWKK